MNKKELKNKIKKICYKKGNFILSSGKKSNFYFDCKKALLNGEISSSISNFFFKEILKIKPNVIIGTGLGGSLLIPGIIQIAFQNNYILNGCIIRDPKDYGTQQKIENLQENFCNAVIVEDVLTTGKSIKFILENLPNNNKINKIITFINRENIYKINNIPVINIFTLKDFNE